MFPIDSKMAQPILIKFFKYAFKPLCLGLENFQTRSVTFSTCAIFNPTNQTNTKIFSY